MACVIADHYLRQRGQVGEPPGVAVRAAARLSERMCRLERCSCSALKPLSRPSPRARSWSSPTTTIARTRAICSSRRRSARPRRWPSSSATPRASSARRWRRRRPSACISIPWWRSNDAPLGTAFTVSVDVRHGLTTGISAEERTQHGARARQRQQRRRRFRAARPCLSAGRQGRRRADALRPHRGLRRSLPSRRAAAGRRACRADERRRHGDARRRA